MVALRWCDRQPSRFPLWTERGRVFKIPNGAGETTRQGAPLSYWGAAVLLGRLCVTGAPLHTKLGDRRTS